MIPENPILVALDTANLYHASKLASSLIGLIGGVKIGKEFFSAHGPTGVKTIAKLGVPIFLDLKFHDIPNTVANAIQATLKLNPFLINVHAAGGRDMLEAANNAVKKNSANTLLIGVTLLTSLNEKDLKDIGINQSVEKHVLNLAQLCKSVGLSGVVCSAREIKSIKSACGKEFKAIVPGVRPNWSISNDQKRFVTPHNAMKLGADYIVVGRPITKATEPQEAAKKIGEEIGLN